MTESIPSVEITIDTGARKVCAITYLDNNDEPISAEGCTAAATLREFTEDSKGYDFACSCSKDGIVMEMDPSTTAQIGFARGVWDLFLMTPDNKPYCILSGTAFINRGVTR
jgi:hypothetical protein